MEMQDYPAYIPDTSLPQVYLLSRHLPPSPGGIAKQWLERVPAGEWILDPFGSSPQLLREIVENGYCVVATVNNPVLRYLIQFEARSPNRDDILRVISTLATFRRDDIRIEEYLNDLYAIECPSCNQITPAQSVHWHRDTDLITHARVECKRCGYEDLLEESGIRRRDKFEQRTAHQNHLDFQRLLTKIAPPNDPKRIVAEEVLHIYTDRAIHGLATLLFYMDRHDLPPEDRFIMDGIFLHVFDQANKLWATDDQKQRPKSLQTPPEYIERNIWNIIESSVDALATDRKEISVRRWSHQDDYKPGIYIYPGRLSDFSKENPQYKFKNLLTIIPRPNQVFWNSSGVWASILWEDTPPVILESMLSRRRYDWTWFTQALASGFRAIPKTVNKTAPILFLCAEIDVKYLIALTAACILSELNISSICINQSIPLGQLHITHSVLDPNATRKPPGLSKIGTLASEYLNIIGEPSLLLKILSFVIPVLSQEFTSTGGQQLRKSLYKDLIDLIEKYILENPQFEVLNRGSRKLDIQKVWLADQTPLTESLSDQIECYLFDRMMAGQKNSLLDTMRSTYSKFRGPFTPDGELINEYIEAYSSEVPDRRTAGIETTGADPPTVDSAPVQTILENLGQLIGFRVSTLNKKKTYLVQWIEADSSIRYSFFILNHALFGDLAEFTLPNRNKFIILPNHIVDLAIYKLGQNPPLADFIRTNFLIISNSQIRYIANTKQVTKDNFPELLDTIFIDSIDKQFSLF